MRSCASRILDARRRRDTLSMYYLYILQSKIWGRYYIGTAQNTDVRLRQHNQGRVPSTKPYRPWSLIFRLGHATLSEARRAEIHLKATKKRSSVERFIQKHGQGVSMGL